MAYFAIRNIRLSLRGRRRVPVSIPVIYLGSVQILCPLGEGICGSVEEIFENCGEKLKRNLIPQQKLEVTDFAFELSTAGVDTQEMAEVIFNFRRIIFCGVDSKRPKILVFNYHHSSGRKGRGVYRTHALMCDTKGAAKKLALVVANHFKSTTRVGYMERPGNFNLSEGSQLLKKPTV